MNFKAFISFSASILFILISVIGGPGCANIVPPEGGLRDSLPPILTKATPKDSTRNFQGNKINLTFDEYIEVDNFFQNVVITPIQKSIPSETHKLNTISIRLRDTLEANTTYTINFGNSIKDLNEGNVFKNFSYVFSTGPYLDSLTFSGNVLLAETGKIDSTLIVMLHRKAEDSAVFKEKPRYITKLDSKGNFTFNNLPSGTFHLYALKDETRSYLYRNKALFGFADSPIVVQKNAPPVTLYAYEGAKETQVAGTLATTGTTGAAKPADKRLKFQTTIKSNKVQDLLQPFSFMFDRALKRFDSAKVHFSADTSYTPVTDYTWTMDSSRKKVTLNYQWEENTLYHLILEKDFATDTLNQQLLRADTITFKSMQSSDYGKVSIRFRNLDLSKNPVLQLVQNDVVVNSFPLTGEIFSKDLFLPGEYDMRILNDANNNGIWDPGEFFGKHKQPEIVKPVERRLNVRVNYLNEIEIAL
ncbi:MAG TPA: Ig-like domain-containing protein [Chitinophagaceae bacterium]|nr:Ig-like domain-containing protein [Chitinophagaceae bacterium]